MTLGVFKNANEYRLALSRSGKHVSNLADMIIGNMPISRDVVNIDLCEVTGAELGFTEPALYEDADASAQFVF